MFRYVALAWRTSNAEAQARAADLIATLRRASPQWRTVHRSAGLEVHCADESNPTFRASCLANGNGVVLGALFSRSDEHRFAPLHHLNDQASAAITGRGASELIERYWGNYVAILQSAERSQIMILKDPTGSLPCFITTHSGVHIALSCITDALAMRLKFNLHESYLRECVVSGGRNQLIDPLENLSRVHGGECITLELGAAHPISRRLHWNPLTYTTRARAIDEPARAAHLVHQVVRNATRAWADRHDHVLHRLSGGLDSTIILGCLADATSGPRITCCTYYDPNGRMDERPWARLAVERVRCVHIERAFDPSQTPLSDVLALQPSVYPTSCIGYLFRSTLDRDLAELTGAKVIFSGDGGDSGFCSDSVGLAVVDYLQRYGPRLFALRLAARVGLRVELSAWSVLHRSIRRWLQGSRLSDQREGLVRGSDLVSPELRHSFVVQDRYPHPWFSGMQSVPWSVIRRMGQLVYAPEFYDLARPAEQASPALITPLYSQPVIETLLRIPMHVHFLDGRDRGLARRAFQREAPEQILRRTWKDAAPGYFDRVLASNRAFLRTLLLDGVLTSAGLLSRAAVERSLSDRGTQLRVLPGEILKHMDTEVWARSWNSMTQLDRARGERAPLAQPP